jgi:hypothetical protein
MTGRNVAKRVVEVLGPQQGAQVIKLADALMRDDDAAVAAFARCGGLPDGTEGVAGQRPSGPSERVVEVDLSVADANGKLKAFGGADSDRANALLIGKTVSAVSSSDEMTLAAMREMKPRDFLEGMALSLAVSAYAASADSFAHAKEARPLARSEHLLQATRSAMTALALIDAVRRFREDMPLTGNNVSNAGLAVRAGRESYNAYQRDLMRSRRALAKARQMDA